MLLSIFKRIIVFSFTLPIVFCIMEIAIRIVLPQPVNEFNYGDIYTTRYSKTLNRDVISLVPSMTRILNDQKVTINSTGQRDYEYQIEKKNNDKRIAIVGSSINFGFKLRLENTFGKLLEKILNEKYSNIKYEVLLFGRPGFKAKETYALIKDKVISYNPDLIIYSFAQNNYEDQSADLFFSSKTDYVKNEKNKSPDSKFIKLRKMWWRLKDHDYAIFIRSKFHMYLFSVNSLANIAYNVEALERDRVQNIEPLHLINSNTENRISSTETWISLMKEDCEKYHIKFGMIMHPFEMELNNYGIDKWKSKKMNIPDDILIHENHKRMKSFAYENEIITFDVIPVLSEYSGLKDNLYLKGDYAHYDIEGNLSIANYIVEPILRVLR
jgi:hypothetical protein